MSVLVIALGVVSSTTLVLSGLSTQRHRMLVFAGITSFLVAIQYSMTGALAALAICVIGLIRNFTALAALKHSFLNSYWVLAAFLTLQTAAFGLTTNWGGNVQIVDFLPLVGAYVGTVALFFKRMMMTKIFMVVCGGLWIAYEFHTGLYGQMIGETFTLAANIMAFIVLLRASKAGIPETQVENVDTKILDVITSSIPVIHQEPGRVRTQTIPIQVV